MNTDEKISRRRVVKTGLGLGGGIALINVSGVLEGATDGNNYVIDTPQRNSIEVSGTDKRFPVRRVYCLGRNYHAHAIEMGDDPNEKPPFYFMKPSDAVYAANEDFPYPPGSSKVSYEVELVVALGSGGRDIAKAEALKHVFGYGVGLDMTRRDIQDVAKDMRRPWEGAKSFDKSAPCSPLFAAAEIGHPDKGRIWLSIDNEIKQDSDISLIRWNVSQTIEILSGLFELAAGDLIFTGTPEGVGPVSRGNVIRAGVDGIDAIEVKVF